MQEEQSLKEKKRTSIRSRLHMIVVIITMSSLVFTCVLGVTIMSTIRRQSDEALTEATRDNLSNIAGSKAGIANAQLLGYKEYAQAFADFLTEVHAHPENHSPRDRWKTLDMNTDSREYLVEVIRRSEEINVEKFDAEISLESNVEDLLYPVVTNPESHVAAVYWGNRNGLLMGYDKLEDRVSPDFIYDFWDVSWYTKCEELRETVYTDVYLDSFGRGLTVTCSAPYYDKDGNFYGVFGVGVLLLDIYERCVDLDLGEGAYAFLVDNNGNVITPERDAKPLIQSEKIDAASAEHLMNADGVVFLDHGIYYTSARIDATGWALCLHVPQELAMAPVRSIDNGIRTLIITFAAMIIPVLLIVALVIREYSANLTEPILALTADVKEISGGNLMHRAAVNSNDEVGDLATGFNEMTESLQKYIEDLRAVTAEQERIGAELNIATQIQAGMLPTVFPRSNRFEMFATMIPAKEVGGDFYDFFYIDKEHLALVMADVSGKGVPAALFMVIAKTLLKNITMRGGTPGEILTETNHQLCLNNEYQLFVTAWLGVLDLTTGEVLYANAGHEYPALKHVYGEYELVKAENQLPLAAMEGSVYTDDRMKLLNGDRLFLYTDGLPEAKNSLKKRLGTSAMLDILDEYADRSAQELLTEIKKKVDSFAQGVEPYDDLTMMAFYYKSV